MHNFINLLANTKHQLKTIQKIEHDLAYMDHVMIFVYSFIGDQYYSALFIKFSALIQRLIINSY